MNIVINRDAILVWFLSFLAGGTAVSLPTITNYILAAMRPDLPYH